jgi:hypothetical protein
VPKFIKQTLLSIKEHMDPDARIVEDFNTPTIDRTSKQELNRGILGLNNTMDKMDLTDIYRVFQPTADLTSFSAAHETL